MSFYGQRSLPVQCRAFGGHFRQGIVDKAVHDLSSTIDAVFDKGSTDKRLDDITQNGILLCPAGF